MSMTMRCAASEYASPYLNAFIFNRDELRLQYFVLYINSLYLNQLRIPLLRFVKTFFFRYTST